MHWPWSDLQAAHLLCCVPLHPKAKPPAWLISQNFCNYKKGQISPSLLLEPNRDASFSSSLQEHQWSVSAWKAEHGNKIWKLEKDWRDWMICGTFRSYIVTERADTGHIYCDKFSLDLYLSMCSSMFWGAAFVPISSSSLRWTSAEMLHPSFYWCSIINFLFSPKRVIQPQNAMYWSRSAILMRCI